MAKSVLRFAVLSGWPFTAAAVAQIILSCPASGCSCFGDVMTWASSSSGPAGAGPHDDGRTWSLLHLAVASARADMVAALMGWLVHGSSGVVGSAASSGSAAAHQQVWPHVLQQRAVQSSAARLRASRPWQRGGCTPAWQQWWMRVMAQQQ